jgi:hypothetical protein
MLPPAFAAVLLIRACLRFVPLRTWQRITTRQRRGPPPAFGEVAMVVQDVVWAVGLVSRTVPGATCLTQALAAQVLLSRHGCGSRLRIGVARAAAGGLVAHAWLESGGMVVLGGPDIGSYTPLNLATAHSKNLNRQWRSDEKPFDRKARAEGV